MLHNRTINKISKLALCGLISCPIFTVHAAYLNHLPKSEPLPNSIIVKFEKQAGVREINQLDNIPVHLKSRMESGALVYEFDNSFSSSLQSYSAESANKVLTEAIAKLNKQPNVKYAELNKTMHMMQIPNDTRYSEQWHYYEQNGGANLPDAWDLSTGKGVVVGVVDTGIVHHDNLSGKILPGHNYVTDGSVDDPTDKGGQTHFHGTHVSGTIAAETNHNKTVAGVAWDAKIVPVRVLGSDGSGSYEQVMNGMLWAAGLEANASGDYVRNDNANPADVINLSLGGGGECSAGMQETIDAIVDSGTVVVVAAGNESQDASKSTPANCDNVITVGAVGRKGTKAFYTNFGPNLDVAAPGGDQGWFGQSPQNGILSTSAVGTYAFLQGTSMASPHVAGISALVLAANPNLTPHEVRDVLASTTRGNVLNVGLVDAYAAVKKAQSLLKKHAA